jgi:hypothetical protein
VLVRSVALAAASALAVGACADEEADPGAEAATSLVAVLAERLDVDVDEIEVDCPEDLEVEPGLAFTCSVTVEGADPVDLPLVVGDGGEIEQQRAVIPTAAAEAYLDAELEVPAEGPVDSDCGEVVLLVADVGDELRCEVRRSLDGATLPVVVTVLSLDGSVRYRVEAPAAGSPAVTVTPAPP